MQSLLSFLVMLLEWPPQHCKLNNARETTVCVHHNRSDWGCRYDGVQQCNAFLFPLSQLLPHVSLGILTLAGYTFAGCLPCLVYFQSSHTTSHQRQNFCRGKRKCGIKDGIVVIKATEFPVDLRRDLNAPCLHSLWGGAGNINDSPFYLIPCQKQLLWGVRPGRHLAQSCLHTFFFCFVFNQHTIRWFLIWPLAAPSMWLLIIWLLWGWISFHVSLTTDNLQVHHCCWMFGLSFSFTVISPSYC